MFGEYVPPPEARMSFTKASKASLRDHHLSKELSLSESDLEDKEEIEGDDRITLSWKGIHVETKPKGCGAKKQAGSTKPILRGVDGMVTPCSLMALMGASGAGKTTLLNILNFRNRAGLKIDGQVYINGHPVDQKDMAANSVFVQQQDLFIGGLKVKEHLSFHAHLRMKRAKKKERNERVEQVMRQMGLKKCENVKIGEPGRTKGISGGEAKRLAFATEIICKPTLIFCDEPTSGLDSFMAQSLVKLLKRYAAMGRTILCTIHQPSSQTFELFDQICIMAEGQCAFIGATTDCMKAFARAGYPCPKNYNPADHFIFTLAVVPGKEDKCRETVAKIADAFEKSDECAVIKQDIQELIDKPGSRNFRDKKLKIGFCTRIGSWFNQISYIFWRQCLATVREPQSFALRLVIAVVMSIIFGATWFQLDFRKLSTRQSVPGALFAITLFVSLSAVMLLIIVIPENLSVVTRDYLSNVYKIPTYYLAIALFFTIEVFVTAMIIIVIIYWMVFSEDSSRPQEASIDAVEKFPMVLSTNLMVALVSVSIGLFISANSSSFHIATSLATPMLTICMMFSGFLVIVDDIPPYFKMFQYISHFYYGMELAMVAIYQNKTAPCDPTDKDKEKELIEAFKKLKAAKEKVAKISDPMMKKVAKAQIDQGYKFIRGNVSESCKKITSPDPTAECGNFARGQDMLDHFHFEEDHVTRNFFCLLGITIAFHFLAFLILMLKMWKKRK